MQRKIEEFKKKANRPNAWDADVEKLLHACGGDVDLAVSLIVEHKNLPVSGKVKPTIIGYSPRDCETHYECTCGCRFGSWDIFHQEKNAGGTNKYCPRCKAELDI